MKLSVCLLSFNTCDLTKQVIESLYATHDLRIGLDFEIVIADNASTDNSVSVIRQNFPELKLTEIKENLGFSKGNNVAVQTTNPETKYVLFLNTDTTVPDGTLSEMVSFMDANPDVGASSCKVMLADGTLDMDAHRGFPTPWTSITRLLGLSNLFPKSKILNQYNQGWKDLNTTHDVDALVGAFMLVRRDVGEKINWWDEDYFLNGEDIDFCFRVKEAGYRVVYHPQVQITHLRGASKGTRKETEKISTARLEVKKKVAEASVDAMQLFYDKHYRRHYSLFTSFLVDFGLWVLRQKRLIKIRK